MNNKLKALYLSFLKAHVFYIGSFLSVFLIQSISSQDAIAGYKNLNFYTYISIHPLSKLLYVTIILFFIVGPIIALFKTKNNSE